MTLRKHAYSNILSNLPPKTESFQIKILVVFINYAQNIYFGYSLEPPRRGGSNEYPQSMFLSRNMKIKVYSCKPQFYYKKEGFKGSKLYRRVFVMSLKLPSPLVVFLLAVPGQCLCCSYCSIRASIVS